MAATVEFLGTRISDLDTLTNVTAVKITAGGGGPGVVDGDGVIQGTASVGINYPASDKLVFAAYDIVGAGGTALDFTAGGTEEGQLIYVWANGVFGLQSTGTTISNFPGGLGIVVDSNTNLGNDYACWSIYGLETYPGGYQKLVIDPTKTPSASGGTPDLSAIRHVGVAFCAVAGKNNIQGFYMDAIDVGSGLRIYGSGTDQDGFEDLRAADEGDSNNRYGVIKSLDAGQNILQVQGKLIIGDATGINETIFSDIDKTIVMGQPQYQNGTSFENAIPDDYLEILCVGNTTASTDIDFGIKVGAGDDARGRNGLTFLGNDLYNIDLKFNDGNVDTFGFYGSTLTNFKPTGNLIWNAVNNHEFIGSVLNGCSRLEPDSGVTIRNCTFLNHSSNSVIDSGALLFTSNPPDDQIIDIKNCSFVANDRGIQHEASGTFTYDGFSFSDNTFDVFFSTGTASDLVVNVTNPVTPAASITATTGAAGSTVSFLSSFTLTITGFVNGSELFMRNATDGTTNIVERFNEESAIGSYEYTYDDALSLVDLFVLKATGNPTDPDPNNRPYQWLSFRDFELPSASQQLLVQQILDRNYSN